MLAGQEFVEFAAGLIEPLDHRVILLRLFRQTLALEVRKKLLRRVVRQMRHHRRIPNKEWLLLFLGSINEVVDRLEPLAANRQTSLTMPAFGRGHAGGEPYIRVANVPEFPGLKCEIPRITQGLRKQERISQ